MERVYSSATAPGIGQSTPTAVDGSNRGGQSSTPVTTTPPPKVTPAATLLPTATAGTQQENVTLTCSGCNDPVRVKIETIKIEPDKGDMIWTLSVLNNSGTTEHFYFKSFQLTSTLDTNLTYGGTGEVMNYDAYGHFSGVFQGLAINKQEETQITFSFVPLHGGSYTLNAEMPYASGNNAGVYSDSPTVTFDAKSFSF